MDRLGRAEKGRAKAIMSALVAEGSAAIPALREALWSRNQRLRRRVPRVLVRLDAVEAADDLVELLDDPVLKVEMHALRALAEFGLAKHADIFERYIDEDVTDLVVHALRGLELAAPARAVKASRRFMRHPRTEYRAQAAAIIEAVAPAEFAAFADDAERDPDLRIRTIARFWLLDRCPATALDRALAELATGTDLGLNARLITAIVADAGRGPQNGAARAAVKTAGNDHLRVRLEAALLSATAAGAPSDGGEAIGALANALARVLVFAGQLETYLDTSQIEENALPCLLPASLPPVTPALRSGLPPPSSSCATASPGSKCS